MNSFSMSCPTHIRQILFWQNFPSHLQSAFLRNLAELSGCDIYLVTGGDISRLRQQLGWKMPDFGPVRIIMKPKERQLKALLQFFGSDTVHVFSGVEPLVVLAFRSLIGSEATLGIMSEPFVWVGPKGLARILRGRLESLRFGKYIDFVLSIGHMGEKWFRLAGYASKIIFPWGYFVEDDHSHRYNVAHYGDTHKKQNVFSIIFVGQCVKRKGIDLLLKSLKRLDAFGWGLTIVGDGPERPRLERLVITLGLQKRVAFLGPLPHEEAMERLYFSDLLVLPSLWDGWGAVVNEALMRGIRVVCSSRCGAADLVYASGGGCVFVSGSVDSLTRALRAEMATGRVSDEDVLALCKWGHNISGSVAAEYFLKVIGALRDKQPRPKAPWKKPG